MPEIAGVACANRSSRYLVQVTRKCSTNHRDGDIRLADSECRAPDPLQDCPARFCERDARQQLIDVSPVVALLLLFL
jgi:hypothetical protein